MADPKQKAAELTPHEAVEQYGVAVKSNGNDAEAHFNLATAYYVAHDLDNAAREFSEAVRLNDRNFHAHYYLGAVYVRQGQLEQARREWDRVAKEADNWILRAQATTQLKSIAVKS